MTQNRGRIQRQCAVELWDKGETELLFRTCRETAEAVRDLIANQRDEGDRGP